MQNLDKISEDLFNKIRGRFTNVTIGDAEGNVTDVPTEARFFDFEYVDNNRPLGKVSVNVAEDPANNNKRSLTVIYSKDFIANEDQATQTNWFNFLKELRVFSKRRRLNFDIRDINKSNLDKRDYKFLAANRPGDENMTESKLYGTSRISYQNVDNARLVIKHTENVNPELAVGRTQHIGSIYIESNEGERFKYPFKHLGGARAMARHVSEGGKPFDDFGKHIVGLSEELSKLRKFKNYMGRSSVMAESLAGYMDAVYERIATVKKTIEGLQRKNFYTETFESFEAPTDVEVPEDVAENWIDQLTIRQFNEELKDVFPYIYRLVSEVTKAKELGPDDLIGEAGKMKGGADDPCWKGYKMVGHKKKGGKEVPNCVPENTEIEEKLGGWMAGIALLASIWGVGRMEAQQAFDNSPQLQQLVKNYEEAKAAGDEYAMNDFEERIEKQKGRLSLGHGEVKGDDGEPISVSPYKSAIEEIEQGIEELMGQFGEGFSTDAEQLLAQIARNETERPGLGFDQVYDLHTQLGKPGVEGEVAKIIDDMYQDVTIDLGAHPDDDFEKIYDAVLDRIVDQYSDSDADTQETKGRDLDYDGDVDSDDYMKAKDIAIKKAMNQKGKTPIGEFILAHFDRETGQFPKGETAVLTMVEKDYGEQFIEPAKAFIERVNQTFEEHQMKSQPQQFETDNEVDRMRELAGLR